MLEVYMNRFTERLKNSLEKGFIDKHHHHVSPFKPELLMNEKHKRQDVLTSLLDELKGCCLLYTSPSPRDAHEHRMPSSA